MKILITIGHPAHVHFFKNFVWEMEKRGHDMKITATKKDVSTNLLDAYDFKYDALSVQEGSILNLLKEQLSYEHTLYKLSKKFKPDILTGIGGVAASYMINEVMSSYLTAAIPSSFVFSMSDPS